MFIATGISMEKDAPERRERLAGRLFCVAGFFLLLPALITVAFIPIVSAGHFSFVCALDLALAVLFIASDAFWWRWRAFVACCWCNARRIASNYAVVS
jgi:hypothetical protein